ncbi:MAG: methionyl-tRNA formyltransferase [Leptonema sp. (in: bacteria)]
MKIGYFGSPDYSLKLLEELYEFHQIQCVVSNPDSPSDRTKILKPTPVSEFAIKKKIPLFRPSQWKDQSLIEEIKKLSLDVFIIFSYGKIIPKEIIEIPKYQSLNLHGSLLPNLRGASPLQTAILYGYKTSGWTLQKVSPKMDEGDILAQKKFEIYPEETYGELLDRVLPLGIELTLEVLENLEFYLKNAKKQEEHQATYCKKITPEITRIHWNSTKEEIHNLVRALNPNPIAKSALKRENQIIENIKIYRTRIHQFIKNTEVPIGYCITERINKNNHLYVKTKNDFIEILELQFPNKKKIMAHDCINGNLVKEGDIFL